MSKVWKFTMPLPDARGRSFIEMPSVVEPLSVGMQGGEMVVWALVEPEAAPEEGMMDRGPRRFVVANTGDEVDVPRGARFLGTVTEPLIGVVWHVWDGDAETTA